MPRTCAYQRVRNANFWEKFANVENEWSLSAEETYLRIIKYL